MTAVTSARITRLNGEYKDIKQGTVYVVADSIQTALQHVKEATKDLTNPDVYVQNFFPVEPNQYFIGFIVETLDYTKFDRKVTI